MLKQTTTIVLLTMFAVACGTDDPQLMDSSENRYTNPDGSVDTNALFLENTGGSLTAEAMTSKGLLVTLKDRATMMPVANENVTFTVLSAPDMQTSLSALTAVTDEQGVAKVDLRLGMLAGRVSVEASHPKARGLVLDVNVSEVSSGTIRVDIQDPSNSPVALAPYRVTFHETSSLACTGYSPRSRVPDPVTNIHVADRTVPVEQPGLPAGKTFTVVVEALGNAGMTLASGCADGLGILAGNTTNTRVQLELVPIVPSGVYTVQSEWNFANALASQSSTADALVTIVDFMANPGRALLDMVVDEIEDVVGFSIGLLLDFSGLSDRIGDYINQQLFRFAGLETFVAVSGDLNTMLNELEVETQLTIEKTDSDFAFRGREQWTKVVVHWSWECVQNNTPDCGRHEVPLNDANGFGGMGPVSYEWAGSVSNYDELLVESHQASIDTGKLQLFLFEKVVLPALTNGAAHSIEEALAFWIDCNALAARALNGAELCDPTGFFCVGQSEAASACEGAIGAVANRLTAPIRNHSNVLAVELAGTATLMDSNSNGQADEMRDGATTGLLGGSGEAIEVTWSAVRAQ